jgi:hypothetical protein
VLTKKWCIQGQRRFEFRDPEGEAGQFQIPPARGRALYEPFRVRAGADGSSPRAPRGLVQTAPDDDRAPPSLRCR